jgi:ligand-binding sensor domain-containing protein
VRAENDSTRFVGTINGGFLTMEDTAFTLYNINNLGFPDNSVPDIFIDQFGYKWCATPAGGLVRFYGTSAYTYNFSNSTIPSETFDAVTADSAGNVYLGSYDKGVVRKQGNNFFSYNTTNSPLPDDMIYSITLERAGIIWAGTASQGVVRIDEALYVGTDHLQKSSSISCFPNPVKDVLYVAGGNGLLAEVFNSTGEKVISSELIQGGITPVNFRNLPAGI